jgi:hypothetical protein
MMMYLSRLGNFGLLPFGFFVALSLLFASCIWFFVGIFIIYTQKIFIWYSNEEQDKESNVNVARYFTHCVRHVHVVQP